MRKLSSILAFSLIGFILIGAGINKTFRGRGQQTATITGTYATSQVDTLYYNVEGTEAALRFWVDVGDSASITSAFLRRMINEKLTLPVAGDTLIGAVVCRQDSVITGSIAVATIAQKYRIIITFAATAQGVTTPTITYGISKQY